MRPSTETEEAEKLLIESARSGNPEAFSALVRLHSTRIYNISRRILKNEADAEDNLQNVWCSVHQHIHRFKGRSRFGTWLVSITINEALMKIRKRRWEGTRFQEEGPNYNGKKHMALEMEDAHADPERQYLTKELAAKALRGLPPSLVEMFTRHKAEGWTQRELAREMGVTIGAVKSRIFHARRECRRNYRLCVEYGFPGPAQTTLARRDVPVVVAWPREKLVRESKPPLLRVQNERTYEMRQPLRLLLALLLALSLWVRPSNAQKVKTDYVKGYNFASLKRFAWRKNHLFTMRHPEDNEVLDRKIMRAVTSELAAKGIVEDAANPDFYLFYHGGPGDEGIRTGASPPATWDSIQPPALTPATGSGMWNPHGNLNAGLAPSVWYSIQGQLLFYAEDAKSKLVVWQGAATKTWHDPKKARKNEDKEIEQIVGKSFKDFPPKSRK